MSRHTNHFSKSILTASLLGLITATPAIAADSITEAITGGKTNVDIRWRYETVEETNTKQDATANTVRTRIGYKTGEYQGLTAFVELDDTSALGDEEYSPEDTTASPPYSTIADPQGSEVNQANLAYSGIPNTTLTYGRQRVILDNARFVGNVGWRQDEQTFNAIKVANTSIPDTTLTYLYVTGIRGIKYTKSDSETHLLNANYKGIPGGSLSGYVYAIDDLLPAGSSSSTQTIGARYKGATNAGNTKILYTVEFATVSDYADNTSTNVDADYTLVEGGTKVGPVTAQLGYELLGGDGTAGNGFQTPLATKHAFNGWADMFLSSTPDSGLEDIYVSVGAKVAGVKLLGVYHMFAPDTGSGDYGDEIDLLAAKKFGDNYTLLAKYASFSHDSASALSTVDTDKLWLMGQVKF
jgi:hypothetical protein